MAVYYKAKLAESLENSLRWYVVETNGTETGREFWIETSRAEDCKCEIADGINKAMNGWFDVNESDIQLMKGENNMRFVAKKEKETADAIKWYVSDERWDFWIKTAKGSISTCRYEIAMAISDLKDIQFDADDVEFSWELNTFEATEENIQWAESRLDMLKNSIDITAEEKAEILLLDKFVSDIKDKKEMGIFWSREYVNRFYDYCEGITDMYNAMHGFSARLIDIRKRTYTEIAK